MAYWGPQIIVVVLYQTPLKLLGGDYAVGTVIPYVWLEVKGHVQVTGAGGTFARNRTEKINGIGDILLYPFMISWTALLPGFRPGRWWKRILAVLGYVLIFLKIIAPATPLDTQSSMAWGTAGAGRSSMARSTWPGIAEMVGWIYLEAEDLAFTRVHRVKRLIPGVH